jgi:hypothetical protein
MEFGKLFGRAGVLVLLLTLTACPGEGSDEEGREGSRTEESSGERSENDGGDEEDDD